MIDAFVLESMAAAAGAALLMVVAGPRRPRRVPIGGTISRLPFWHRRAARAIVAMAREHDARHAKGSLEAFTARETLRTYLPETIAAYLAVPPALRSSRRAGGLSPDQELSRQLRTLRAGLEHLREADADCAASRMTQNAAFLNERFGPPPVPKPRPAAGALALEIFDLLAAHFARF